MQSAHEEDMLRIVMRFYAVCAAPTRRFRRWLCAISLVLAVALVVVAVAAFDADEQPRAVLALFAIATGLLILALRLAFNDARDVREHYRQSRRDLFVSTFSDEEFQRKVREKRAALKAKESESGGE